MKFAASSASRPAPTREPGCSGFTLAEVLAALLFMAIVIPVAVQGLRIASLAGSVAVRKALAARVAERLLTESIVTTNWLQSYQSGTLSEGNRDFRWTLRSEPWIQGNTNQAIATLGAGSQLAGAQPVVNQTIAGQVLMNLLTVEVLYTVQGQDYSVRLSTLVNPLQ